MILFMCFKDTSLKPLTMSHHLRKWTSTSTEIYNKVCPKYVLNINNHSFETQAFLADLNHV